MLACLGVFLGGVAEADIVIMCESKEFARTTCLADGRQGIRIENQESKARCLFNQSWGYDAAGLWTDQGCRATFRIFTSLSPDGQPAGGSAIDSIVAPQVVATFKADDRDDQREPGYGRADAAHACAVYAFNVDQARGADGLKVQSVDQIIPRGRRDYDLIMRLIPSDAPDKPVGARCTIQNGRVTRLTRQ